VTAATFIAIGAASFAGSIGKLVEVGVLAATLGRSVRAVLSVGKGERARDAIAKGHAAAAAILQAWTRGPPKSFDGEAAREDAARRDI